MVTPVSRPFELVDKIRPAVGVLCFPDICADGCPGSADLVGDNRFTFCFQLFHQLDDRNRKIHGLPCQFVIAHGTALHRRYVQHQGAVKRLSTCREHSNEDVLRTNEAARCARLWSRRFAPDDVSPLRFEMMQIASRSMIWCLPLMSRRTHHAHQRTSLPKATSFAPSGANIIEKSTPSRAFFWNQTTKLPKRWNRMKSRFYGSSEWFVILHILNQQNSPRFIILYVRKQNAIIFLAFCFPWEEIIIFLYCRSVQLFQFRL